MFVVRNTNANECSPTVFSATYVIFLHDYRVKNFTKYTVADEVNRPSGFRKSMFAADLYTNRMRFKRTRWQNTFDSVSRNILLIELQNNGLGDHRLSRFKSYLRSRFRIVNIYEHYSTPIVVTSGVPRESYFSRRPFNIFIDKLNKLPCHKNSLFILGKYLFRLPSSVQNCH